MDGFLTSKGIKGWGRRQENGFEKHFGQDRKATDSMGMLPRYLLVFACLWGSANSHPAVGNLAGTIRATQSSLADFLGDASNAVDGNDISD
eukprot:g34743.t1